ncbi:phosphonoacetate hydrolase [Sneathiella limimaris]|uniref:phosphonoacetate hydrolase n=1 Tax=Sneathiella limimaris TaxID=1964213 RepID=UPI00146F0234|nr:phosphonoacetate hydrolase [Sneathiella limimaris]
MSKAEIAVNGRSYAWPKQPVVVVCIDGSEPAYIEQAIKDGVMPYMEKALANGADLRADCVVPSFTNPNNLSIVTGQPPKVHGICGNYFYDVDADAEVMMNDPKFLRVPTIFKAFFDEGAKIAVVTAKDKLRKLLGHGLDVTSGRAICFSSEKSADATMAENGIDDAASWIGREVPSVYSAELSEFIFACGVKLMDEFKPDLMYLSTTDYIQHKHAPGTPVANEFYAMLDKYMAELDARGAVIALTADHGMKPKFGEDGQPDVIYLQDVLDEWLGDGKARVILPITDPYVVHHGALGSFATAYLPEENRSEIIERLKALDGIEESLSRAEGCAKFELPEDRTGDVILVSTTNKVLGTSVSKHDLTALKEPLRSHGGVSEQRVPLLCNKPVQGIDDGRRLRNFDIFDMALNYAQ